MKKKLSLKEINVAYNDRKEKIALLEADLELAKAQHAEITRAHLGIADGDVLEIDNLINFVYRVIKLSEEM